MSTFLKQRKPRTADETFLLRELHAKVHRAGKTELIDFSSATLVQVRDGNTLSDSAFVRRGLPLLQSEDSFKVPDSVKALELVQYLKTNGDLCQFAYLPRQNQFLIATRTSSTLCQSQA